MILAERLHVWYFWLPNFSRIGLAGKVIDKLAAMLLKRIMDATLPDYYRKTQHEQAHGLYQGEQKAEEIICSLTSFPARINQVWISIECILRQTLKPDRIILWLSKDQFPDERLPETLTALTKRGLEIRFSEGDMKSHKKYLYALRAFPQALVVTLDDDLYYDRNLLANLLKIHAAHPEAIATNRAHRIRLNPEDGSPRPYRKWKHNAVDKKPGAGLMQTGGYATLYKTRMLHEDFDDTDLIKELAFHADDIWLKVMTHLKGYKVVTNRRYNKDPITVKGSQLEKLVTTNVFDGGNDRQLASLMLHYKISGEEFKH